jgi:hypothetical protein
MYTELSRPDGDVSRWEKVFTRLQLLNTHYPLQGCTLSPTKIVEDEIFKIVLRTFLENNVVFFGGFAVSLYTQPFFTTFDVLSLESKKVATRTLQKLNGAGFNAKIHIHEEIDEYLGKNYEINVDGKVVAYIYEPIACYNYNILTYKGRKVKIASVETMLSFYLLFLYIGKKYDTPRIICTCQYLIEALKNKKIERFSLNCIGTQKTLRDIFIEKDKLFKKYKNNKEDDTFIESFFRYNPSEKKKTVKSFIKKTKRYPMHLKHQGLLDIIGI